MYNMVPGVGEGAPPLSLNNAQYASNFVPEAGQVCYIKDLGLFKIGNGVTTWASLSYMPRRWSATATNLLATTNGDGNEKIVGSIVIPANTLAIDGDAVELRIWASYLNNTGSNQVPQIGISLNSDANLFMSLNSTSNISSAIVPRSVTTNVQITRISSSSVNIQGIATSSGGRTVWPSVPESYGTWDWPSSPREFVAVGVTFACSASNTYNFKMILATHVANNALHQITGLAGRGILLT